MKPDASCGVEKSVEICVARDSSILGHTIKNVVVCRERVVLF